MSNIPCDNCHKNMATVHLTEISGEEKREVHLCEDCAKQKGGLKVQFFPGLLGGLIEEQKEQPEPDGAEAVCPECGFSFADFKSSGRLGCPRDYEVFGEYLMPLIERIHGSIRHTGKVPSTAAEDVKIERRAASVQRELDRAVEAEDYERAAELRDEIRALRGETDG